MRWRNTLIAVLIFVGLLGYVHYFDNSEDNGSDRSLVGFSWEDVRSVTLVSAGETVEVTRRETEDDYRITSPLVWPADRLSASALFDAATGIAAAKHFKEEPARLSEFELKPPLITVFIQAAAGEVMLEIGGKNPSGEMRYVRIPGDGLIHLVNTYKVKAFDKTLLDLRKKNLFEEIKASEIMGLAIRRGALHAPIRLSREDSGWRIQEPFLDRADNGRIRSFLQALLGLQAENFIDHPGPVLSRYGLAAPLLKVELDRKEGQSVATLSLGATDDDTYFAAKDGMKTLFKIHRSVAADLMTMNLDILRDPLVIGLNTSDVQKLDISFPDGSSYRILKKQDGFWCTDPVGVTVESGGVAAFLKSIKQLKIENFMDRAEFDGNFIRRGTRITLFVDTVSAACEMVFFPSPLKKEKYVVIVSDRAAPMVVSDDLAVAVKTFIEQKPWDKQKE
ncbi:MAG: DUF4340 domain-containing protein [bacterium]|nr:DUF4340 domain-containing protein [bacterium]